MVITMKTALECAQREKWERNLNISLQKKKKIQLNINKTVMQEKDKNAMRQMGNKYKTYGKY